MLTRKIETKINNWLTKSNKALLIDGARQVGKTYIIKKVLEERNINYVEFNLISETDVLKIFKNHSSIDDLILKLSLYSSKKLIPNETIIFLDEIEEYKEIVTLIKFLVEDGRFRFILSGSLLGIELQNIKSAPVGYLETYTMYPLDFEEFLQIFNISDSIKELLYNSYVNHTPVDSIIHKKLIEIFNLYLIVGGMPAAVNKFSETKNLEDVIIEHNSIIDQYKLDFTKYEDINNKLFIKKIYEAIPSQLNEKNKRFQISNIDVNIRFDRHFNSFIWLTDAGVAIPVYNSSEPTLPLLIHEKRSLFKLFLSDVGMLTTMYGKYCKLSILNNENDVNKGAIYENVVAQELLSHNIKPYYYNSKKFGEIDFLIEYENKILPIEVKSGKSYQIHSALNNILNSENYNIEKSIVLSNENISVKNNIIYLPIYMIMFIKDNNNLNFKINIENLKF